MTSDHSNSPKDILHYFGNFVAIKTSVGLVLILTLGAAIGRLFFQREIQYSPGNFWQQLFSWDGKWYYGIATSGYHWDPKVVDYQNIAFFPLQALIDKLCLIIAGQYSPLLILGISLSTGIASIFYFEILARKVIGDHAPEAVMLYSFWPASAFYLMGYPTGIISLCIIGAFHTYCLNKKWLTAVFLGIGTSAAPTVIFVVLTISMAKFITWIHNGFKLSELTKLIAWGLLACSGLELFIFYQAIVFHDPFSFIEAQDSWGKSPHIWTKITRLISPSWYWQPIHIGLIQITNAVNFISTGDQYGAAVLGQFFTQRLINMISFLLAITGLTALSRRPLGNSRIISRSGWVVFLGYMWCIVATDQNMLSTPRLVFPAVAIFMGLAYLFSHFSSMAKTTLLAAFILSTFLEIAFVAAGGVVT